MDESIADEAAGVISVSGCCCCRDGAHLLPAGTGALTDEAGAQSLSERRLYRCVLFITEFTLSPMDAKQKQIIIILSYNNIYNDNNVLHENNR